MRIRKSASRVLGSAYSSALPDTAPLLELPLPAPLPPSMRPCPSAVEYHGGACGFAAETASRESCELNLSPWDLISELNLSDGQEEDLVQKYLVNVVCRASWLLPTSMLAATVKKEEKISVGTSHGRESSAQPRHSKVAKKTAAKKTVVKMEKEETEKRVIEPKKKVEVKTEAEDDDKAAGEAKVWTCKKNDGKRWHCRQSVSAPNSLCEYHFVQKRSYYTQFSDSMSTVAPATASKPSTSSKTRKKKSPDLGEGFYYYAGFGPSGTKRHCRTSSSIQEPAPERQEEEAPAPTEEHAAPSAKEDDTGSKEASRHHESSCEDIAGIAGGDEESSDDIYSCNGNREGVSGDGTRKSKPKKRWRKPVKARSLKSLM